MYKTRPVTFDIPQGDNYQTTTISSFKGIQYSENPLNVDPNSASDLKNVYLNDSGCLTTRPRIEKESALNLTSNEIVWNKIILNDKRIFIHTVSITNLGSSSMYFNKNFKIGVKQNNGSYIYYDTILTNVTVNRNVTEKCSAFIVGEKIYVCLRNKYIVIRPSATSNGIPTEYTAYDVSSTDTYLPVIKVQNTKTSEEYNLLNDKYQIKYFLNDSSELSSDLNVTDLLSLNNEYYSDYSHNFNDTTDGIGMIFQLSDGWALAKYNSTALKWNVFVYRNDSENKYSEQQYSVNTSGYVLCMSRNGRFIVYEEEHGSGSSYSADIHVVDLRYGSDSYTTIYDYVSTFNDTCAINNNGDMVILGIIPISSVTDGYPSLEDRLDICLYSWDPDGGDGSCGTFETSVNVINSSQSEETRDSLWNVTKIYSDSTGTKFSFFIRALYLGVTDHNILVTWKLDSSSDYSTSYSNNIDLPIINNEAAPIPKYSEASPSLSFFVGFDDNWIYIYDKNNNYEYKLINYMLSWYDDHVDKSIEYIQINDSGNITFSTSDSVYQIDSQNAFPIIKADVSFDFSFPNEIHFISKSLFGVFDGITYIKKYESSYEPKLIATYKKPIDDPDLNLPEDFKIDTMFRFQNNYWFYGESNRLWRTSLNDPTYIEPYNYVDVGDSERITGINVLSDNLIAVYKKDKYYLITKSELNGDVVYTCTEAKGDVGNIPVGQTITTKYTELPVSIDDSGIFFISQVKNVTLSEHNTTSLSSLINIKFLTEPNKESMLTHNHRYWTYFIFPGDVAKVYVLDNRSNEWFYWELPEGNIVSLWEEIEEEDNGYQYIVTKYITRDGNVYALRTIDKVIRVDGYTNEYYTEYQDVLSEESQDIEWFWQSQILPLTITKYSKTYPAIGYSKQLVQTGFLFTDTDESEEYSLDYSFNVYRKALSTTKESSISGTLNRVRSILKKTYIPRLSFLQIKLNNSDLSYIPQTNLPNNHNKLNLIQLKFKYKVMEERV